MWLILALLLALASPAWAGQLDASWTAPTQNTDGSALGDLASYRLYWFLFPNTPCPGTQFLVVPSQTATPVPNTTITKNLPGLTQGMTYNVQVTAVDTGGNESPCSTMASAVARADTPPPPLKAGTALRVAFGPSPSGPDFIVVGLTPGQVIKNNIQVSAVPAAGTTIVGVRFDLLNSSGVSVAGNSEGAVPFCFVGDSGALPCTPFNTATVPNGAYTLRAVATTTAGVNVSKDIPFTIAN